MRGVLSNRRRKSQRASQRAPPTDDRSKRQAHEREDYYHGLLPREDVKGLLTEQGDFLLRTTEPEAGGERREVISVCWNDRRLHIVVNEKDGRVRIEDAWHDTLAELVAHYRKRRVAITRRSGALLLKPVPRQDWELRREQITLKKRLGEGAFGEVWSADLMTPTGKLSVAVKKSKLGSLGKEEIKELCREARLMRQYQHDNVVRFYGVSAEQEPLMLCMELVTGGALDSHLRDHPKLAVARLTRYCLDAARGMAYLHEHNCIHRDVASRNCLIGKEGEVKIADFGLSRQTSHYKLVKQAKVPVKWLAPETLSGGTFSQATDVFSYGVLMWEAFSAAAEPYPDMTTQVVQQEVKTGYRMPPPERMPPRLRPLLLACWHAEPAERPSFTHIAAQIAQLADFSSRSK